MRTVIQVGYDTGCMYLQAVYRLYLHGLFSTVYPTVPYQDVVNVL